MSFEAEMNAGDPIAARIALPGAEARALLGPWAAVVPAWEIAARMTAAATAMGWSMALGPWTVRLSVERRHGERP